ncbi:MAG: peptidoglycan editing factor PgeF [Rhodanobacter sp.]|nr:MAG: peptidoglycan editing factor PgeF [Rhodanobacter sp.]TAM01143.1 MAG: peptidoglycan editing factor PgeF [Rhodanobacter sp.]TAM41484.1 MAG: peptidoglycan editing factor PgeF [Rhodanobacter sp.]TAN29355.1 MAG: peptidoglycan editing factor PgeF [Rhodanobacter sp.]
MTDSWIFPDWPAPPQVHAAITTRHGPGISTPPFERFNLGLRSGDASDAVQANREALQQVLGLPSAPRWLHQVHGVNVAQLGPLPSADELEADAAVSHIPGTVLAILTADCLPVLFCADDGSEIGAAHAGWRGLAAGVLEATLTQLETPPKRLLAWLGPCIGAASYEVGKEVRAAFVDQAAGAAACFEATRPGHWTCDLAGLARQRLAMAGLDRMHGGGFDTRLDPRFYSYRRDGVCSGRFASLIWLSESRV